MWSWFRNEDPEHLVTDVNTGRKVNWVKPKRAMSPLRGSDDEIQAEINNIVKKMYDAGEHNPELVKANIGAARAFLASQEYKIKQDAALSAAQTEDEKAAYANFFSVDRDIIITNLIRHGHVNADRTKVYVGWRSPYTGKEYILQIQIPEHLRSGGKSKRVKRTKTCKSKRVKRSKTCKNRVHKRRN